MMNPAQQIILLLIKVTVPTDQQGLFDWMKKDSTDMQAMCNKLKAIKQYISTSKWGNNN